MITPDHLRRIAIWSRELSERELEMACAGITERSYRAGEFVFLRGDRFEYWTGVVSGLMRMGVVSRGGKAICQLNLGNTAYDADSFALTLKPGCDQLVTRFAPVAWRFDRGQFVMLDAKGQSWRFEENDENAWSRIPAMRPPLTMVRPQQPAQ